jgi:hypothetical protein
MTKRKKKKIFYFRLFSKINAMPMAAMAAIASKPGVLGFDVVLPASSVPPVSKDPLGSLLSGAQSWYMSGDMDILLYLA